MNFNQDEIAAIIGAKELECIALRREVGRLNELLKEKESAVEPDKRAAPLQAIS